MTDEDVMNEADRQRIERAAQILQEADGFYDTPRLRKTIDEWLEEKRVEASMAMDRVKDIYRRRSAVIGFRCGVVIKNVCNYSGKRLCVSFFFRTFAEETQTN